MQVGCPKSANSEPKTQNELLVLLEDLFDPKGAATPFCRRCRAVRPTFREVPWTARSAARGSAADCANGLVKNVSLNPYIKLTDGRPTETEGTSEMKKYLVASILI